MGANGGTRRNTAIIHPTRVEMVAKQTRIIFQNATTMPRTENVTTNNSKQETYFLAFRPPTRGTMIEHTPDDDFLYTISFFIYILYRIFYPLVFT